MRHTPHKSKPAEEYFDSVFNAAWLGPNQSFRTASTSFLNSFFQTIKSPRASPTTILCTQTAASEAVAALLEHPVGPQTESAARPEPAPPLGPKSRFAPTPDPEPRR